MPVAKPTKRVSQTREIRGAAMSTIDENTAAEIVRLRETVTRLNRRCQRLESDLTSYKRDLRGKLRAVRAWRRRAQREYQLLRSRNINEYRRCRQQYCGACLVKVCTGVDVYSYYPFQQCASLLKERLQKFFRPLANRLKQKISLV